MHFFEHPILSTDKRYIRDTRDTRDGMKSPVRSRDTYGRIWEIISEVYVFISDDEIVALLQYYNVTLLGLKQDCRLQ